MDSAGSEPQSGEWLLDHGLQQLELLFRAIVYQPAEPILIADNDRNYRDASCGAAKLFGLPRSRIIGRRIDDFAEPSFRPHIEQLWHAFLQRGEQHGTFRLVGADGSLREVEYTAKGNVLPVRHVLALHDKSLRDKTTKHAKASEDPAWVRDYALYLFDTPEISSTGIPEQNVSMDTRERRSSVSLSPVFIQTKMPRALNCGKN